MSNPKVTCEVDTCTHWISGNYCAAGNIDILNEEEGKMSQAYEQTECKTFYGRGGITSYLGSMDNVNWAGMATEFAMDGTQLTPTVTCTVDSCSYWVEGDKCEAKDIRVTGQGADECQDTNCYTFENKEKNQEKNKRRD